MEWLQQSIYLFQKGGPVMYLLAVCSLVVGTITVERFLYYRQKSAAAADFVAQLEQLLDQGDLQKAEQYCRQTPGIVGEISKQGLAAFERGHNVEAALTAAAQLAAAQLRRHLQYLSAIVTMAPLLGLLGTVVGMIQSFSVFNIQSGQPMAITGGVGEALVATAAGLMVAILALSVHVYFSHRLDDMITAIEQICALVSSRLMGGQTLGRGGS